MNSTIDTLQWLAGVIGRHANKLVSSVYAACSLVVAMHWVDLTQEQIGAIGLFATVVLGLFTEHNTVSKQRMGERVNEEKAKVDEKVKAAVAMSESGITTAKDRL